MVKTELQREAVPVEVDARRDQVGEIPAGGLEVIDLAAVVSAETQIQATRSAMQHLPATHGRALELGVHHWSDAWIRPPNRGENLLVLSFAF